MREILFRGKSKDNEEWVYGDLIQTRFKHGVYIEFYDKSFIPAKHIFKQIIPDTVGQYIGMTDKNGVKIFEGDVVIGRKGYTGNPHYPIKEQRFAVKYEHECYRELCDTDYYEFEVIGNIHDNPDLLEAQHENT